MTTTLTPNLNNYCVYFHIRKDTDKVFYIGKGWTKTRPYSSKNRNPHWHSVVNKAGKLTKIIAKNLTNEQASKLERRLISLYRNRNIKIVNITDGGDGVPGYKHTKEAREKMSAAKLGKKLPAPPGRGQAISLAKKGKPTKLSKSLICNETGELFNSCMNAARAHNICHAALAKHLARKPYYKTVGGRTYTWLPL